MITAVAVCGAGTMGSGIAQVAAHSGFNAILFDLNEVIIEKAKAGIQKNLQFLLDKQKISADQKEEIYNRKLEDSFYFNKNRFSNSITIYYCSSVQTVSPFFQ